MHVGEYLYHLRSTHEPTWSLDYISEKSGLSKSYLSEIERGVQKNERIPLETIEKIAIVFGMGAGDFLVKAGYTINPALPWECKATFEFICSEGEWSFKKV